MCEVKTVLLDTIGISRLLGSDKVRKQYEKKRSAKAITKAAMYRMFGLQSPSNDYYRQAYMCNEYLFQNGTRITSNYCQKKCCTVCNRIKSAQLLAKYGEAILGLSDLHLVTLTNVNVHQGYLEDEVDTMYKALTKMKKNIYKTYKIKVNGFRTFECTYSFTKGFNPHFHYIVETKEAADLLVELWLKQFPNANRGGQDVTRVEPTKKSLLEVFKYLAKPISKGYYSPIAYDELITAARKHRSTDPLGSIRGMGVKENADDLNLDDLQSIEIDFKGDRIEVWKYVQELYDYVAPTGELLLGTPIETKTLNAIKVIENSLEVVDTTEIKNEHEIFKQHAKAIRGNHSEYFD